MNILQALIRLRDDLKLWVTNNLQALREEVDRKANEQILPDIEDYYNSLGFDTSEIVFDNNVDVETIASLDTGVLDKLILDYDGNNDVEI